METGFSKNTGRDLCHKYGDFGKSLGQTWDVLIGAVCGRGVAIIEFRSDWIGGGGLWQSEGPLHVSLA